MDAFEVAPGQNRERYQHIDDRGVRFGPDDILADDWEIQEPTVTISRSQFWEAWTEARDEGSTGWTMTCYAQQLARKLGLEGK